MNENNNIPDKKSQIMQRAGVVYFGLFFAGMLVFGQIIHLQWFQRSKWNNKYNNDALQQRDQFPERADIYDANGNLMVTSVPYYNIYFDAKANGLKKDTFAKYIDSLSICLVNVMHGKSKKQIKQELIAARENGERYKTIALNVDFALYKKIKHFPIFRKGKYKGGFISVLCSKRTKPFKDLAKRTLGFLRVDSVIKQQIGEVGLEKYYDNVLKGIPGNMWMQKLPGGVWMPLGDPDDVAPEDGQNIISSIDINLQDYASHVLEQQLKKCRANHGTVILMEVKTGYIKALVNLGLSGDTTYSEIYNYAVKEKLSPGSTFKLASYMAAFEDGYIKLTDTVDAGKGSVKYFDIEIKDTKESGYGKISVLQAFEYSSNVATSKIIQKYYKNKQQKFIERLYDIGIASVSGIDLGGEEKPDINTPDSKSWSGISLAEMSIGYETQFTPMQILTFFNAVANNGTMIKPRLAMAYSHENQITNVTQPEIIKQAICSQKTLANVKTMLEGVVKKGTAKGIYNKNYSIAGKTGTAKYYDAQEKRFTEKYRASFAGYFPADNPKYSCYVMIDKPLGEYYGAEVAAPVFKKIADKIYTMDRDIHSDNQDSAKQISSKAPISKNGFRPPMDVVLDEIGIKSASKNKTLVDWVDTKSQQNYVEFINQKINKKSVPDVVGMGARDAVWLLESLGLNVKISGRGAVKKQSVTAGTAIKKNMTVSIELESS
jgi:cell division protein FtsI (penicillin-binding protein 3)